MFGQMIDNFLGFAASHWINIPLGQRFFVTPWLIVLAIYFILAHYEKLHLTLSHKDIIERNYGWYIYVSFVIPYFIYLGVFFSSPNILASLSFLKATLVDWISFFIITIGAIFTISGRIYLGPRWSAHLYKLQTNQDEKLITTGPYKIVRHPIYFGHFLMVLGSIIVVNEIHLIIFSSILTIILGIFRAKREEGLLSKKFNDEWGEYKHTTPAFVPYLHFLHS